MASSFQLLLCPPTSAPPILPTRSSSRLKLGQALRCPPREYCTAAAPVFLYNKQEVPRCCLVRSAEAAVAPATDGEEAEIPAGLERDLLPRHVAVIMDGNSRWATARGLPASAGHEAGSRALREMVKMSGKWGISALTVYAFSTENWLRPKVEVDFLMMLFQRILKDNMNDFLRDGVRVSIIGDSSKLPKSLLKLTKEIEETTVNNSVLNLIVAISYSGRSDIVQACRKIAQKVEQGQLGPPDITESVIAQELETNCSIEYPYPDLLIRTSGEQRLSNFLLWESAYAELYFAKKHWPDFGEADYAEALLSFQGRQRRFGLRSDTR
ncbi:uncharacterized protein M6B38_310795 [Iris pallida]|uniref:Alkyl transferase n=1 Tax=Iris pallida TaxID=29817 RepID=A0AAX6HI20_IRIPA|nr:uncharacterized protein M6B38_310795 [Iris pallida]